MTAGLMEDIFPAGVQAPGNNLAIWLKTSPADPSKPTLAELNADSALDISCYLKKDALDSLDLAQETEDDSRFCDAAKREAFGEQSFDQKSISHIVDPQGKGDQAEKGNLAAKQIEANSTGYMYLRMGVPQKQKLAAGDVVTGFTVTTGADFVKPVTTGKYYRTVMTSFTMNANQVAIA